MFRRIKSSARRVKRSAATLIMTMGFALVLGGMVSTTLTAPSYAADSDTTTTAASPQSSTDSKTTSVTSNKTHKVKKDGLSYKVTQTTTARTVTAQSEGDTNQAPTSLDANDCVNAGEISPTHIKLEACSYSSVSLEAAVSAASRALIEGAMQLVWWFPDHHVTVSNKAIRKAPWIKIRYTPCPQQSKSIAKQANGAKLVIAKVGSVICNTGKAGDIIGGFKWTVSKGPAVLKWNNKLGLYEHLFNLEIPGTVDPDDEIVGYITVHGTRYAIVRKCRNRMGGHVDHMYTHVVQVQSEGEVIDEVTVTGKDSGSMTVSGSLQCPAGTLTGTATVATMTEITEVLRAKASAMAQATDEAVGRVKASARAKATADASAQSVALASIELTCSGTQPPPPPPPVDHAPQVSGVYPPHVYQGGNVYLWFEASDSDGDPLSLNVVGDSNGHVSGVIPSDVRWDGTPCPTGKSCYRATLWGDNVGFAHIVATVTANGLSATSVADVEIVADQFKTHQGHYTPNTYVVHGRVVHLK